MKVGILTFHRAINFGAFLQALATLRFLRSNGFDAEITDYMPEGHAASYRYFNATWKRKTLFAKFKYLIYLLLHVPFIELRKRRFAKAQSELLNLGGNIRYASAASLADLQTDALVYGSDQIWWNSIVPGYEGFDPVYWGESVSKSILKVAYAPSMGIINFTTEDAGRIKKWLRNFSALSVREQQLSKALEGLTDKPIPVVLDPVFLLDKAQWLEECKHIKRRYAQPYLLIYNLQCLPGVNRIAKEIAARNKWGIVELKTGLYFSPGRKTVRTASPLEFVALFRDASYVITTSFHGAAFSIIMQKQFIVPELSFAAGRITSILSLAGIPERYITGTQAPPAADIDYTPVSQKITAERARSRQYLLNALSRQ